MRLPKNPRLPTNPALRRVAESRIWWISLAILVLNDHLLKSTFPGALTGKLSDFAGLFIAAPLFAALVARSTQGRLAAYIATGAVFSAINLWRPAADVIEALLPWRVWTDPSDLVALPMLLVAWHRYERGAPSSAHVLHVKRSMPLGLSERLAVALGGLACLATSPAFPVDVPPPQRGELQITGLYAETYEDEHEGREEIRVRRLLPDVELDCEALAARPHETVTRRLFGPVGRWSLGHRELISYATEDRACDVVWLEHDDAGIALVRWSSETAGRIALERNGDAIGWVEEIGVDLMVRRSPRAPIPARTCEPLPTPPTIEGTWPLGTPDSVYTLRAEASPDGCTRLTLTEVDPFAEPPSEDTPDEPPPDVPSDEPTPGEPSDEPTPDEPSDEPSLGEPSDELPPASTVLYACGYPAELFSIFDGPVRLAVGAPVAFEQFDADGTLRARFFVSETSEVPFFLEGSAIAECEATNACGEIATPWRVELSPDHDDAWREEGGAFVSTDGLSRAHVLLAQSSVAVDRSCVDGVGELGRRFVVAYATRFALEEPPMEEPPMEEPPMEEPPMEPPMEEPPMEPPAEEPPMDGPAEEPGGEA